MLLEVEQAVALNKQEAEAMRDLASYTSTFLDAYAMQCLAKTEFVDFLATYLKRSVRKFRGVSEPWGVGEGRVVISTKATEVFFVFT